ncbi:MAG: PQQ-binding-like beta-propeller repeat protein [Bryobacteraceae bacterium]
MRFTIAILLAVGAPLFTKSDPSKFDLATTGCAMAHCDTRMSDATRMTPPTGSNLQVVFHDPNPQGSGRALGCASNGRMVACTYANSDPSLPNLVVYDGDGNQKFSSGTLLDDKAAASVPMMDSSGGLIAADDHVVVRYDSNGNILWQTPTPGGTPISPVITRGGTVVLATRGGPISVYSVKDGIYEGLLYPRDSGATDFYDTVNTPCVVENRIYISMALRNDPQNTGRLYAFDISHSSNSPIRTAWYYTFGGPSGASPLCEKNAVYFDGNYLKPGNIGHHMIFAVRDDGSEGTLMWQRGVGGEILANMPLDPRGGLWYFAAGMGQLVRCDLDTGEVRQLIETTALLGNGANMQPASAMSMSTDANSNPLMTLSLQAIPNNSGGSYVVNVNLVSGTVNWAFMVAADATLDRAQGQFPIVHGIDGSARVAFSTWYHGLYLIK